MTTSSAEPSRLEAYPNTLVDPDAQLTTLAANLGRAMTAFSNGASSYLPAGFDPAAAGELVRGLRDESQYQAAWVARIGTAFRQADSDPDGDGIYRAEDDFIAGRVGPPTLAEAAVLPPPGSDPATVARWWSFLPVGTRERLIQESYAQLGMLRGLPAEDIDRVNRLRLEHDIADLRARLDSVTAALESEARNPTGQVDVIGLLEERGRLQIELGNAEKIALNMQALDDRHRGEPPGPRPYLLTYAYQNEGRFAVALGNPDTADHTGVVVPGTGHDVKKEGGLFGPIGDGQQLYDEMNLRTGTDRNAVIVWLGTDMPDEIPSALNPTYGDAGHGAAWLRDDVMGYQAAHAQANGGNDGHTTVIGHSYGSYMTGESVKAGLRVDDFVSVGSPGIRAENAGAMGMANEHVWAGAAEGLWWEDGDLVSDSGAHGMAPTDASFGATVFDTSDSSGHSEYYRPGSQSLRNLSSIATGRYDDVERRPPDHY